MVHELESFLAFPLQQNGVCKRNLNGEANGAQ